MLQPFGIESLATLDDGRLKAEFDEKFAQIMRDLRDRPQFKAKRKIVLSITFEPASLNRGQLDTVNVAFKLEPKTPPAETRDFNMAANRTGLVFNDESADNVRQGTLPIGPQPTPPESTPQGAATAKDVTPAEKKTHVG